MQTYLTNANPVLNNALKQDTIKKRMMGKTSPSIFSYDIPEFLNCAIGAFGIAFLPYLLIKKTRKRKMEQI